MLSPTILVRIHFFFKKDIDCLIDSFIRLLIQVRVCFHALVQFSKYPSSQGWARGKPGARNSIQTSVWMMETDACGPLSASFLGTLTGSWIRSGSLTCCATMLAVPKCWLCQIAKYLIANVYSRC